MRRKTLALTTALEEFLEELTLAGRAKSTVRLYRYLLGGAARKLGIDRKLRSIERRDILHYLSGLSENGNCQSYVNLNMRILKRFCAWAVDHKAIEENPLEGLKSGRVQWNPVPPFTDDEITRLLGAANAPMERAIILLLLDTGLRASELCSLRLDDIDFGQGHLAVNGKGGKVRTVALNEVPARALQVYLRSCAQRDERVWPEPWDRRRLGEMLDRVARRAKVARVFPHRFRHSFASRFLARTGDALALKQLLGHSSLVMTERYIAAMEEERALTVHRRNSLVA